MYKFIKNVVIKISVRISHSKNYSKKYQLGLYNMSKKSHVNQNNPVGYSWILKICHVAIKLRIWMTNNYTMNLSKKK